MLADLNASIAEMNAKIATDPEVQVSEGRGNYGWELGPAGKADEATLQTLQSELQDTQKAALAPTLASQILTLDKAAQAATSTLAKNRYAVSSATAQAEQGHINWIDLQAARLVVNQQGQPPLSAGISYADTPNTLPFGNGPNPIASPTSTSEGYVYGDCTTLAGFNSIAAKDPNLLFDHLHKVGPTQDGKNDIYSVNLFWNNKWQNVLVDSSLPNKGAGPNAKDPSQLWSAIYTKAIAQVAGGYNNVDVDPYSLLTGKPATIIGSYGNATPAGTPLTAEALSASTDGQPVTAFSALLPNNQFTGWFNSQTGAPAAANAPGAVELVTNHAYSITGVTRDAAGNVTSVTMVNPWNSTGTPGLSQFTLSEAALAKLYTGFSTPS